MSAICIVKSTTSFESSVVVAGMQGMQLHPLVQFFVKID